MTSEHETHIAQTATHGWHYAKCTCGWRSLGYAPDKRSAAEHAAEAHVATMAAKS